MMRAFYPCVLFAKLKTKRRFEGYSIDAIPSPLLELDVDSPIVIPWEDDEDCNEIPTPSTDDIVLRCSKQDDFLPAEKKLKCVHCDYTTEHRSYHQRHTKGHAEEKRYQCAKCDYRTSRSDHMNNHMRTHTSEKPFSCKHCEFRCAQQATLYNHLNRRHFKDRRTFMCEYCSYRCHIRADMNKHIRRVHEGRCILLGV